MTLVCDNRGERTFLGFESFNELRRYTEERGIEIPLCRCHEGYEAWKAAR